MNEPPADLPDGADARRMLDRSQQAARFLDLTRQRGLLPDDDDDEAGPPLVAAHLRGVMAAEIAHAARADDDPDDREADDPEADDIRLDPDAWSTFRPGAVPPGDGLGRFTLDDDGDVFGDGNGFASDPPFGP